MSFIICVSIIFAAIIVSVSMPGNWNYGLKLTNIEYQLSKIANALWAIEKEMKDKEKKDDTD